MSLTRPTTASTILIDTNQNMGYIECKGSDCPPRYPLTYDRWHPSGIFFYQNTTDFRVLAQATVNVTERYAINTTFGVPISTGIITPVSGSTFPPELQPTPGSLEVLWGFKSVPVAVSNTDSAPVPLTYVSSTELTSDILFDGLFPGVNQYSLLLQRVILNPFFYGVQAGGMTTISATVQTQIVGTAPYGLLLRIASKDNTGAWVEFAPTTDEPNPQIPNSSGFARWTLRGLDSNTEYNYTITMLGSLSTNVYVQTVEYMSKRNVATSLRSRVGRFRTNPDPSLSPDIIRFGSSSCQQGVIGLTYQGAADKLFDFFIFLGDFVYADGAVTTQEYSDYYNHYLRNPELRALLASTGWYAIADDHEVGNNWYGAPAVNLVAATLTPEETALQNYFLSNTEVRQGLYLQSVTTTPATVLSNDQILTAYDVFDQYIIGRPKEVINTGKRYWKVRWGNAEFYILQALGIVDTINRTVDYTTVKGQYFSTEQLQWLLENLKNSDAQVKFIVSGTQLTSFFRSQYQPGTAVYNQLLKVANSAGFSETILNSLLSKALKSGASFADAYGEQLDFLMDFIRDNDIKNVFLLGGDTHCGTFMHYSKNHPTITEFTASASGTLRGSSGKDDASDFLHEYHNTNSVYLGAVDDLSFTDFVINFKDKKMLVRYWLGQEVMLRIEISLF